VKKKARILTVDDDEQDLRFLEKVLTPHGYEVILAHDGQEAAKAMSSNKPNLILMDIFMPKVYGYAALKVIKKDVASRGVPVVMVTGAGQKLNKMLAEKLGAAGYITKPFKPPELLKVINYILRTL
jgi:twitching motility two-component system response regulator PilH